MATRRRIGVSIATTEAARRALMQPVPCWEKKWSESVPVGMNTKIYKWVKTDKIQQFSDDEGEVDEPLAPLPDEPEVVEGDEEMDQDEPTQPLGAEASEVPAAETLSESAVAIPESQDISKPPSPRAQTLSFQPPSQPSAEESGDALDASLKPLDGSLEGVEDVGEKLNPEDVDALDMATLGPDGTAFEGSHDLSQLEGQADALMGGPLMDQSLDPFAENTME